MKKNKKYIVLIIILFVFLIGMFLVFGIDELNMRKSKGTFIIDKENALTFNGGSWTLVNNKENLKQLNWKKFNSYAEGVSLGEKLVWYDGEKWYLFNSDRTSYNYVGNLFAYNTNYDLKYQQIDSKEISDFTYIKSVLNDKKIDINSNYTNANYYELDFDKDSKMEKFYTITNAFITTDTPDKYFSFVFMVKNDKIYMLYSDVANFSRFDGCRPYINSIADFDNDNDYEILVGCDRYSIKTPIMMLYEFNNNKFKIIISNQ